MYKKRKISRKKNRIIIFIFIVIAFLCWKYILKAYTFQYIYGQKLSENILQDEPFEVNIQKLSDPIEVNITFGKYDFDLIFRAKFKAVTRVVYVDIYDQSFYFGIKPRSARWRDVYNTIAPLDVSIFIGGMAADENWQKFKIEHDYRIMHTLLSKLEGIPIYKDDELQNIHTIPATKNIRRGFDTVKRGDVIKLEGYLVDWREMGEFADTLEQGALKMSEISEEKIGGEYANLCMFLYVTKLVANGYIY